MAISVSVLSEIPAVPATARPKTRSEGPVESFSSALSTAEDQPAAAPSDSATGAYGVNDSQRNELSAENSDPSTPDRPDVDDGPEPDLPAPVDDADRATETAVSLVLQQVPAELPTPVSVPASDRDTPIPPAASLVAQPIGLPVDGPSLPQAMAPETDNAIPIPAALPVLPSMPADAITPAGEALETLEADGGIPIAPVPVAAPVDIGTPVDSPALNGANGAIAVPKPSPLDSAGEEPAAPPVPGLPTTPMEALPETAQEPIVVAPVTIQPGPAGAALALSDEGAARDEAGAALPEGADKAQQDATQAKAAATVIATTAAGAAPAQTTAPAGEVADGEPTDAAAIAPAVSLRKPVLAAPGEVGSQTAETADVKDDAPEMDSGKADKSSRSVFEKLMADPATGKPEKDGDSQKAEDADAPPAETAKASPPKPDGARADAPRVDPVRPDGVRSDAPRIDVAQPTGDASSTTKAQPPAAPAQPSSASTAAVALPHLAVTIASRARGGERQFDIRLDPADLGRIDVKLSIDENGTATTRISVERMDTLDLLQRDSRALERALTQAGFKTEDGGLQFSLRDRNDDAPRQQGNAFADRDDSGKRYQVVDDAAASDPGAAPPPAIGAALYGRGLMRLGGIDVRV